MDDLVERVNTRFVPIVSRIPGFQEYLFVDAGEGAHLTISLYDDPSGPEQSTRNAASWAAENVATLIEGPPQVTTDWVRIHVNSDRAPAATPTAYRPESSRLICPEDATREKRALLVS